MDALSRSIRVLAVAGFGFIMANMFLFKSSASLALIAFSLLVLIFEKVPKVAFYIFVFVVFFIPPTVGMNALFFVASSDRIATLILMCVCGSQLLQGRMKPSPTPLDTAIWILLGAMLFSDFINVPAILKSGDMFAVIKAYSSFLQGPLLVLIIPLVMTERKDVRLLMRWMIVGAVLISLYTFVETATHKNIFAHWSTVENYGMNSVMSAERERSGMYRAKSTQLLPLILGTFLSLLVPLVIDRFFSSRGWRKTLSLFSFFIILGGIIATFSRTSYVTCGFALILSLLLLKRFSQKFVLILVVLGLFGLVLTRPNVQLFVQDFLVRMVTPGQVGYDRENSAQARLEDYPYVMNRLKKNPLLGQGFATYSPAHKGDEYLDNAYLYRLVEGGILGLLAFLFFGYRVIFGLGRILKNRSAGDPDIGQIKCMHAGCIVFFLACATYDAFGFGGASLLFWIFLGLIISYIKIVERETALS